MSASNRHFLNNQDLWDTFSLVVEGGSASFLSMPRRKESLSYDWQDEHGTVRDLDAPRFEERQAVLQCAFVCNSIVDYEMKTAAFFAELAKPGWQSWRVVDQNETYLVYYISETATSKPFDRLQSIGKAVKRFTLTLGVSVNASDVPGGAGSGLPVTIYNFDGSVAAIIPGGGSYTLGEPEYGGPIIDGVLLLEDGSNLAAEA